MLDPRAFRVLLALAGGLLLGWAPASTAQSGSADPPAVLTLAEALRRGIERGPTADEYSATLRSADAGVTIAGLRPNPTLDVEAENVDGSGRYADGAARETTAALAFPLELGGKRAARVRLAEAERSRALAGAETTRSQLALELTELFVEAVASARRADVARAQAALSETSLAAARSRIRGGKASPIEAQRAEVVRLNADVSAGRAEREAELARSALTRLTGIAEDVPLSAPWFDSLEIETFDTRASSPALAIAQADVAAAGAGIDAARRERIPTVTLSAGVRRFADVDDRAAMIALSVPIPVLNTGRAAVVRAQAELELAEARMQRVVLEQERAVDAARIAIENARAAATTANGAALAAAEEAARIARIGYDAGKFSQLELIEAERVLAETRDAAITALQALHVARARLYRLTGRNEPIFKD